MLPISWQLPYAAAILASALGGADGFSAPTGVDTTARKRAGKRSFLRRQSRDKLPPIATPDDLHNLACSLSQRKRGSHSFYKGWVHWRSAALDAIRHHLSANLPHPADEARFENLFFRLGVASDVGEMPSFEDAGARSGYALEFFCRARNLADLYVDAFNPFYEFPDFWIDGLAETPMLGGCVEGSYSMVSLGGGPGFDFVGAALATTFCSYTAEDLQLPAIDATILDFEEGWGDLVEAMGNSTQQTLLSSHMRCNWGGKCDITKSIFDPSNAACLARVNTTNLWTCQYCVAENANRLQDSEYVFFRELFEHASAGSMFVISEVHPRLWPDFYHLMEEHCPDMQVGFNKGGRQMLLRKAQVDEQKELLISEKDRALVSKFEELGKHHERKINSGWQRQAPKIRGV
ncbi:hypothetical protein ACHAXT_001465 [Thalassiosira profunda]